MINKLAYTALGSILIGFICWLIWSDKGPAWPLLIPACLLFLTANLDKLARFRVSTEGLEAETREVVREAKDTLSELRDLASLVAANTLSLIQQSGRLGGYSDEEKDLRRIEIEDLLRKLGINQSKMDSILDEWHRFVEHDYRHYALGKGLLEKDIPLPAQAEWERLRGGGITRIAQPDEIERFYLDAGILTDERREVITDYRYYIQHKRHRRPEVWARRHDR